MGDGDFTAVIHSAQPWVKIGRSGFGHVIAPFEVRRIVAHDGKHVCERRHRLFPIALLLCLSGNSQGHALLASQVS